MTAAAHRVANNVIKFLRWLNTDENGNVAEGFMGVVFDASEQNPSPVDYCPVYLQLEDKLGIGGLTRSVGFFS